MNKSKIIIPKQFGNYLSDLSVINWYNYHNIDSTNKRAWELSHEGEKTPLIVTAKSQTAGKGQRNNHWQSTEGGLYLSLMLDLNLPIQQAHQITLFSIWGIVKQLRQLSVPVQIKWLNDLILDDYKLGGILTEIRSQKEMIKKAVIGVGVNYDNQVPEGGITLKTWLKKSLNSNLNSLSEIREIIVYGLLEGYHLYRCEGIKSIVNDYNNWLNSLNQQILINSKLQGKNLGINQKGDLQIEFSSVGSKTKITFSPESYRIFPAVCDHQFSSTKIWQLVKKAK
jgi:BirA family biotin operon repressor/biotin-[acetyl-CoA-carboxylase] ligase